MTFTFNINFFLITQINLFENFLRHIMLEKILTNKISKCCNNNENENLEEYYPDEINDLVIDEDTYNSIQPSTTSVKFPNGIIATKIIDTSAISIYDYELDLNESKRNIKVIKEEYAPIVEEQLQTVMGTLVGR